MRIKETMTFQIKYIWRIPFIIMSCIIFALPGLTYLVFLASNRDASLLSGVFSGLELAYVILFFPLGVSTYSLGINTVVGNSVSRKSFLRSSAYTLLIFSALASLVCVVMYLTYSFIPTHGNGAYCKTFTEIVYQNTHYGFTQFGLSDTAIKFSISFYSLWLNIGIFAASFFIGFCANAIFRFIKRSILSWAIVVTLFIIFVITPLLAELIPAVSKALDAVVTFLLKFHGISEGSASSPVRGIFALVAESILFFLISTLLARKTQLSRK